MNMCVCVCVYVCIYAHMYKYMFTSMYVYMYVCMYVCMHVFRNHLFSHLFMFSASHVLFFSCCICKSTGRIHDTIYVQKCIKSYSLLLHISVMRMCIVLLAFC